jgi:outer membrane immunogenic protein
VFTPVPVFTWTGFYAGVNAGYAWSNNSVRVHNADGQADTTTYISDLGISRTRLHANGFAGGAQLGYNYQFTPGSGLVLGFEADAQYTDLNRRRTRAGNYISAESVGTYTGPFSFSERNSLQYLGTVRGRLGYAFDRLLVYGTGGFAYGQIKHDNVLADGFTLTSPQGAVVSSGTDRYVGRSTKLQTGYVYGGGIEYALPTDSFLNVFRASAVTLRAEYLHYDLGRRGVVAYDAASNDATFRSRIRTQGDIARVGVNYKFGTY